MNWSLSLVICLLIVAAVFLNVACYKEPVAEIPIVIVESEEDTPEVVPYFYCSHKVGSVVTPGESIVYTLKTANLSLNFTLTVKAAGFNYNGSGLTIYDEKSSTTVSGSILATSDIYKCCWGEGNCFVAEKNSSGSWIIKSLPFIE